MNTHKDDREDYSAFDCTIEVEIRCKRCGRPASFVVDNFTPGQVDLDYYCEKCYNELEGQEYQTILLDSGRVPSCTIRSIVPGSC